MDVLDASIPLRLSGNNICIYCNDKFRQVDEVLTDEHVVPESLGGKLILEQSSCRSCAASTSKFERTIARQVFDAFRVQNGIGSKRPAKQANRTQDVFAKIGREWLAVGLPLSEFPVVVQMPAMEEPRLLARQVFDREIHQFRVFGYVPPENIDQIRERLGATRLNVPTAFFDIDAFGSLLLKVAHCFSIISRSHYPEYDLIIPTALSLADDQLFPKDHLIGGYYRSIEKFDQRHGLWVETIEANDRKFLSVIVRLFGDHGFPAYRVIVGVKGPTDRRRLFRKLTPISKANAFQRRQTPQIVPGDWDYMCGKCTNIVVRGCLGTILAPTYCGNCGWLSVPLKKDRAYATTMRNKAKPPCGKGVYDFPIEQIQMFGTSQRIFVHVVSVSDEDDGNQFNYRLLTSR
ncbi:HNH endonuclease [Sphingorhabdus sp.]|jgi:hypothetical protein|uniref:HNH endonuclease n=1 Tax=Sphingorhabdus sp. TaxID=1902408 RepID=UPI003BB04E78